MNLRRFQVRVEISVILFRINSKNRKSEVVYEGEKYQVKISG